MASRPAPCTAASKNCVFPARPSADRSPPRPPVKARAQSASRRSPGSCRRLARAAPPPAGGLRLASSRLWFQHVLGYGRELPERLVVEGVAAVRPATEVG